MSTTPCSQPTAPRFKAVNDSIVARRQPLVILLLIRSECIDRFVYLHNPNLSSLPPRYAMALDTLSFVTWISPYDPSRLLRRFRVLKPFEVVPRSCVFNILTFSAYLSPVIITHYNFKKIQTCGSSLPQVCWAYLLQTSMICVMQTNRKESDCFERTKRCQRSTRAIAVIEVCFCRGNASKKVNESIPMHRNTTMARWNIPPRPILKARRTAGRHRRRPAAASAVVLP